MRAPRQHELFQLNNQLDFSSLLAERTAVADATQKISYILNLEVIPAGPTPVNPQELLNRDDLDELFQWAGKTYAIVLLDTSSLTASADVLIVAAKVSAALLVTELKRSQINIMGLVLKNPPLVDVG